MNIEQSEETVLKMNRIQKPFSESTIPSLFCFLLSFNIHI